uniref:Uncharacterized protein n=1 Tax=Glossina pallidipes TaxID=7398 RepID=A0A1A9Z3Z9_GLOPL
MPALNGWVLVLIANFLASILPKGKLLFGSTNIVAKKRNIDNNSTRNHCLPSYYLVGASKFTGSTHDWEPRPGRQRTTGARQCSFCGKLETKHALIIVDLRLKMVDMYLYLSLLNIMDASGVGDIGSEKVQFKN